MHIKELPGYSFTERFFGLKQSINQSISNNSEQESNTQCVSCEMRLQPAHLNWLN